MPTKIIFFISFLLLLKTFATNEKVITDYSPLKQLKATKDYLSIIGLNPDRSKNSDIRDYNTQLVKDNPCLNQLASEFYYSMELEEAKSLRYLENYKKVQKKNVSLDETVISVGQSPGWLWRKALKFSNGDKNLAMQLIGLCGHDDKYQMNGYYFPISDLQKKQLSEQWQKKDLSLYIENIYQIYINGFTSPPTEVEKRSMKARAEEDLKAGLSFKMGIMCPSGRDLMFYPQSLSIQADISPELKNKIIKYQAPTKGAKYLPAKTYHIMGAAYTSCLMLQRGVPEVIVKPMVLTAINGYRGTTLCQEIRNRKDKIPKNFDLITAFEITDKLRKNGGACQSKQDKELCDLIIQAVGFEIIRDKKDVSPEILKLKLQRMIAKFDATEMFFKSYESYFALRCNGNQITSSLRNFLEKNSLWNKENCPKGLSIERCNNARQIMSEWAIDFEWSEQLHLAGFNFAKDNCPQIPTSTYVEDKACESLKSRSATLKDINSNK